LLSKVDPVDSVAVLSFVYKAFGELDPVAGREYKNVFSADGDRFSMAGMYEGPPSLPNITDA